MKNNVIKTGAWLAAVAAWLALTACAVLPQVRTDHDIHCEIMGELRPMFKQSAGDRELHAWCEGQQK